MSKMMLLYILFENLAEGNEAAAQASKTFYDEYFAVDPTPSTPEEKQAGIDITKKFVEACQAKSGKILPYISTNNSVRDMESIRRALGES